jgi:hypothetical protein
LLDVLELFEPKFLKFDIWETSDVIVDSLRYIDAAGLCQGFEPGCYVYGITEHITGFSNDGAVIETHTTGDPPLWGERLVRLHNRSTYGRSATGRLHYVSELTERQIAGFLKNSPTMFASDRLNDIGQNGSKVTHALELMPGQ